MGKILDLTGQKFGYLTVLQLSESKHKQQRAYWKCQCKCGNITDVASNDLRRGNIKSCGCKRRESHNVKHGMHDTRIYRIWTSMCKRCYNPNAKEFKNYGGRGIVMCDEWKNDFRNFCKWAISSGYHDSLTIERIDNNDNYSPENCKWTTSKEQANNRRNTVYIEKNGVKKSLSEWCEITGTNRNSAYTRYSRAKKLKGFALYEDLFLNK